MSTLSRSFKFARDENNRIVTDYNGKIVLIRDTPPEVKQEPSSRASRPGAYTSPQGSATPDGFQWELYIVKLK